MADRLVIPPDAWARSASLIAGATLAVSLGACGGPPAQGVAGSELVPTSRTAGEVVPGPDGEILIDGYAESFSEVFETQSLAVIVRATDEAWQDQPPGGAPAAGQPEPRESQEAAAGVTAGYLWRKFEVIEVLHGDYDKPTINYGFWVDRTEPGKTYVLFAHVLRTKDGRYWRTDEDYSEGIPAYEMTADELLVSTDASVQRKLPGALTLGELREQIRE